VYRTSLLDPVIRNRSHNRSNTNPKIGDSNQIPKSNNLKSLNRTSRNTHTRTIQEQNIVKRTPNESSKTNLAATEKKEANHLDCAKEVIGGEAPGGAGFPGVEVGGVTRVPSGGSGRRVGHVITSLNRPRKLHVTLLVGAVFAQNTV
jgi:hypothetical protein